MPEINWIAIIVAGLVPTILGALYYGPIFGKIWMDSLGYTEEDFKGRNEALIYGSALVLAMLISMSIKMTNELVHKDVNSAGELVFSSFHTFGHGALHGAMLAITLVVPVFLSLSLFQKNSGKNMLLNAAFWIICFAIMGGILDAWV